MNAKRAPRSGTDAPNSTATPIAALTTGMGDDQFSVPVDFDADPGPPSIILYGDDAMPAPTALRPVTGWLTADGRFFEHRTEADLHVATDALTTALVRNRIDPNRFITLCETHATLIRSYLDALSAFQDDDSVVGSSQGDD